MARFNPATYDPAADSSNGKSQSGTLTLVVADGEDALCLSGNGKPVSKGRKFSQGGDAQLKGKLMRAHATGTKVTVVGAGGKAKTQTAMALAKELGWDGYLTRFAEGVATRAQAAKDRAANQAEKAKAAKAAAKANGSAKKAPAKRSASAKKGAAAALAEANAASGS
jgi:hypothetical protein